MINRLILKRVYKKRKPWSHKGDYGHLLVVGGSKLYTGAPFLAALAALRAGCDLVTVVAPERAANIAARNINLITYPLKGGFIKASHVTDMLKLSEGKDAIVIGNGLGREPETINTVNKFLRHVSIPCVIDADAIHSVAKNTMSISENFVITPHVREFQVLTGRKVTNSVKERITAVKAAAKNLNTTILLKGQVAVVSDGNRVATIRTNPYATKGGTGDVLAGVCGSLLAQGAAAFDAACGASYIIAEASNLTATKRRQGMIATDVIEKIPQVIGYV